jgi:hypothetical protein
MSKHRQKNTRHSVLKFLALALLSALIFSGCGAKKGSSSADTTLPAAANSAADRRPIDPNNKVVAGTKYAVVTAFSKGLPVMPGNFADPFVLLVDGKVKGGTGYAYATNVDNLNIPVGKIDVDTQVGEMLGDALPTLPSWTKPDSVWAPSVYQRSDNTYVMYYTTELVSAGRQCVSVATSSNPGGPFVDTSSAPFVCPLSLGGAIDASMVVVNGSPYLIYKSDGNCCRITTTIWSQPLSSDWLSVTGTPTALITNDQAWEADVVEAPEMFAVSGQLWLFYSGNDWNTPNYGIGFAKCQSVTGPCTKPTTAPLFANTNEAVGTGGAAFTIHAGTDVGMAYHGWTAGQQITFNADRQLYARTIDFSSGLPVPLPYS